MAYRDFDKKIPATDWEATRGAGVRIVGGSMAMRRKFGSATGITGIRIYDPIFNDDHLAALVAFCAPDKPSPLVVEVGFQRGHFARAFCLERPQTRYVGFEVRRKFCEEADAGLDAAGCTNHRLALVDAREALPLLVGPGELDALYAFFPDPWWKRRQRKKRLIERSFVALVARLLKPGGVLLVKTDVEGYADWAEAEMRAVSGLRVTRLEDPKAGLPPTQRERRCGIHGRPTWAVEAVRLNGVEIIVSPRDDDDDDDEPEQEEQEQEREREEEQADRDSGAISGDEAHRSEDENRGVSSD